MEIKKIIGFCKSENTLRLFDGPDCQWISDGKAAYPLRGCPRFDEYSICLAYDIPEKKRGRMSITYDADKKLSLSFEDTIANEQQCAYGEAIMGNAVPVTTEEGVKFINGKYFAPLGNVDSNMLFVFERRTEGGTPYFAIKEGFMLMAVVMPYECINESFVERLREITQLCELSLQNRQEFVERMKERENEQAISKIEAYENLK